MKVRADVEVTVRFSMRLTQPVDDGIAHRDLLEMLRRQAVETVEHGMSQLNRLREGQHASGFRAECGAVTVSEAKGY